MYGYVYLTTNNVTGEIYVGKHKSAQYDKSYLGSGKAITTAIAQYGKAAFSNQILDIADDRDHLNELEQKYIALYRSQYGSLCLNIAEGGDGGDTYSWRTSEEKELFVRKMTLINQQWCSTDMFKARISEATSQRYLSNEEREAQSRRIVQAWANPIIREAQSNRLKDYYLTHQKDNSKNKKPCMFMLGNIVQEFDSVDALHTFLTEKYQYTPDRRTFKKLMLDGANGIAFNPFHKNKQKDLIGMRIFYK